MKFIQPERKQGEIFVKPFFAFIPVTIGRETRWLENVAVEYEWTVVENVGYAKAIRFVDDIRNYNKQQSATA